MNTANQKRCYKCGVMRIAGELTDANAALTTSTARQERTILATAERMGQRYRPTWPLAAIIVPLIAIVTWLQFEAVLAANDLVGPGGRLLEDKARSDQFVGMLAWHFGLGFVAVLAWSFWIALVVANVPSLTAKWPPNSPVGAFFAPFIPIIGWWKPYTVIRHVLTLLTDRRVWPQVLALAWWIGFLASYWLPALMSLGWGGSYQTDFGQVVSALWVRCALLVITGMLAIGVVLIVERWQWAASRRRETVLFAVEASQPLLTTAAPRIEGTVETRRSLLSAWSPGLGRRGACPEDDRDLGRLAVPEDVEP